jgi:Ankyrin repeats (3 copies)
MSIIFWILVALDAAVWALFFVLGLAAVKPSHTNPLAFLGFALIPALLLAGVVALYWFAPSAIVRILAIVLAGAPVLLLVGSAGVAQVVAWKMGVSVDDREDPAALKAIEAAIANNDATAAAAAVRGDRLTKANISRGTVLMLALKQLEKTPGQPEVLRALLNEGLRADTGGTDSLLERAIRMSDETGPDPVAWLLDAGADPNYRANSQPAFFAAVAKKVDPRVLKLLLDHGAKVGAVDAAGNNALYWATFSENWPAALMLLERGIDWRNVQTLEGYTFLSRAQQAQRKGAAAGLAEVIRFVQAQDVKAAK